MPRLPRRSCGHARGECTCTVACGAPEPKTVSRPSSITVSCPTRMRRNNAIAMLRAGRSITSSPPADAAGRARP